ncbi:hypothetical protein QG37_03574 [Candidozyma auris]|nr:hypothetical protein QG37_03574 [[Candida] auris]
MKGRNGAELKRVFSKMAINLALNFHSYRIILPDMTEDTNVAKGGCVESIKHRPR